MIAFYSHLLSTSLNVQGGGKGRVFKNILCCYEGKNILKNRQKKMSGLHKYHYHSGVCADPNNKEIKSVPKKHKGAARPPELCLATEVLTGNVWHGPVSERSWQKSNLCLGFVIKLPTTHSVCPLADNPLRSHTWP